ncbi:MAG: PDZ domain-containing protein [Gemmatimonadaceae bacterium]
MNSSVKVVLLRKSLSSSAARARRRDAGMCLPGRFTVFGRIVVNVALSAGVARAAVAQNTPPATPGNAWRGSFSFDGREFYTFERTAPAGEEYTLRVARRTARGWSPLAPVLLGGAPSTDSDLYPTVSPDARHLVFASYRPFPGDSGATPHAYLWLARRAAAGAWGAPEPLVLASRLGAYNAAPLFLRDGTLLHAADGDQLRSRWTGGTYDAGIPDSSAARWRGWRKDLFVWGAIPSPDGATVLLDVSRVDALTGRNLPADVWVSRRASDGAWTTPVVLGSRVNGPGNDNFASVTPDGATLCVVHDFASRTCLPFADALRAHEAPPAVTSVPLQVEEARVYVPVRVGLGERGGTPRWLILDTGAQPTVLDAALADSLGARVTSAGTTTGAGGGTTRVGDAGPLTLDVDGVPLGPTSVRVAPLDSLLGATSGRGVPGIVGSRFFREHVVELDFGWPVMHVRDPRTFRPPREAVAVPLQLVDDIPYARGWLTAPDGRRVPLRMLVDVGAKATLLLTEPFIRAQQLAHAFPSRVESALGAGMGGQTRYAFARAPLLELATEGAPVSLAEALVGLSVAGTLRSTQYDGLLGTDFLARFRVTFDYSRRRMYLESRVPSPARAELDMSGLYLVSDRAARRVIVQEVRPGSPADAARVRAGDAVVALDGRATAGLSLAAVRRVFRSADGRVVRLVLERGGTAREVVLTLRRAV